MLGPFSWEDPKAEPEPFMDQMRTAMVLALQDLRSSGTS